MSKEYKTVSGFTPLYGQVSVYNKPGKEYPCNASFRVWFWMDYIWQ